MIKQIKRFAPHQTAKVFGLLMAVGSLPLLLPMMIMVLIAEPQYDPQGNPVDFPFEMAFVFPIIYLVFGYISIRIGCWIYNLMFRYVGGFEIEFTDKDNA